MRKRAEAIKAAWIPILINDGADPVAFAEATLGEVRKRLTVAVTKFQANRSGLSLLKYMDGLDPLYLVAALETLTATPNTAPQLQVVAMGVLRAMKGLPKATEQSALSKTALPPEHPLDYDWRFHPDTRQSLCDEIRSLGVSSTLLLGCPTLAAHLADRIDGRVVLVDDNPALPVISAGRGRCSVQQVRADLVADPSITTAVEADCVVADPPFYQDTMAAFIYAAATGSRVGALLYLVLPSRWARPSAAADAAQALALAARAGYQVQELRTGAVRYDRPGFERAAHDAAGWYGVPNDWRTGDVAVLRLVTKPRGLPPAGQTDRHLWCEVRLASGRWRVRTDGGSAETQAPVTVTPGLLTREVRLPTVSRRDKLRVGANVITDDHRAFTSDQPDLLLDAMQALAAREPVQQVLQRRLDRPLTTSEHSALTQVLAQLAPAY